MLRALELDFLYIVFNTGIIVLKLLELEALPLGGLYDYYFVVTAVDVASLLSN